MPTREPSGLAAVASVDDSNPSIIHQSPPKPGSLGNGSWAKSAREDELHSEENGKTVALKAATPTREHGGHGLRPEFRIREGFRPPRDSTVPRRHDREDVISQDGLIRKTVAQDIPDGSANLANLRQTGDDDQQAPVGQNGVEGRLIRKTMFDSMSHIDFQLRRNQSKEARAPSQHSQPPSLKPEIGTLQIKGIEQQRSQGDDMPPSTLHRENILDKYIAQDRDAMQGKLGSWTCVQCASTNSDWRIACLRCDARRVSDHSQIRHWAHIRRKPNPVTLDSDTFPKADYSEQPNSATQRTSGLQMAQISAIGGAQIRQTPDISGPETRRFQRPPVSKPQPQKRRRPTEGSKTGNGQYVGLQGILKLQNKQHSLIRKITHEVTVGHSSQQEARQGSGYEEVKSQRSSLESSTHPEVEPQDVASDLLEGKPRSGGWARWTPDEPEPVIHEMPIVAESSVHAQSDEPETTQRSNDGNGPADSFVSSESSASLQRLESEDVIFQENRTPANIGSRSGRNNPKWSGYVKWSPDAGLDHKIEAKTDPNPPSADIESEPLSVRPKRTSKRASAFLADEEPGVAYSTRSQDSARSENAGYGRTGSRRGRPQRDMAENDDMEEDRGEARAERRRQRKKERTVAKRAAPPTPIMLPQYITVANLATALRVRSEEFTRKMIALGFDETSNDHVLDSETAGLIAQEFNFEPVIDQGDGEDLVARPATEDKSSLPPRPPVVTIMGHVDHGKTTLLDYLRKSSVAASEHGGITQHIGAFSVSMPSGRIITFLDTPGHAAFLSMRQRGANVTDIVVLVVAADDSVKPQTIEAIKHAQAAKVPMIVAINKIDKEDANVEAVKRDLARHSVDVEDYGGDTQVVCVSGKTGQGMDELEDAAIALADILDVRAETGGQAEGWVLEATTTKAGRIATVLVRRGTLRPGDVIVAGSTWARVRSLKNEAGAQVEFASPGTPVEVDGWREQPSAGDEVLQAPDEQKAKSVVDYRIEVASKAQMATDMAAVNETRRIEQEKRELEKQQELEKKEATNSDNSENPNLEPAKTKPSQPTLQEIPFIIKADVSGSVEAVLNSVTALGNSEVRPSILRSGVGPVTEFDVEHAAIVKGHIISFNNPTDAQILRKAERESVQILDQSIIYRLVDDVRSKLEEFLSPLITTKVVGEAEIAQVFEINVHGRVTVPVAGCKVRNLVVRKNGKVRVLRGKEIVYDGTSFLCSPQILYAPAPYVSRRQC